MDPKGRAFLTKSSRLTGYRRPSSRPCGITLTPPRLIAASLDGHEDLKITGFIQSKLFPLSRTSQEWTPDEEDYLCQRRMGKPDWKDIGAEIAVKFGTQRTIQALLARLGVVRARAR